jgi:ribosome biogenesis protein ERB1
LVSDLRHSSNERSVFHGFSIQTDNERIKIAVEWKQPTKEQYDEGIRIVLEHFKEVKQVTWHGKGDYFASVMPEGSNRSVIIHQLSKRRSQIPFSRSKGLIQCVLFHPVKPCIFVAVSFSFT